MKELPLSGLRIVVCRPQEQAAALVDLLEAFGAIGVCAPVITIADPDDGGSALRRALADLERGDWLVVTSPNGAIRAAEALAGPVPRGVGVAAIGPGTAERATVAGLAVDLVPERSIAEGLLDAFPPRLATGGRVVIARAASGRDVLPKGLQDAGWEVLDVVAYQTMPTTLTARERQQAMSADGVVFTSSSTVDRLVESVGVDGVPPLVASIGPATSATVRGHGLDVVVEAADHSIDGVVEALVEHASAWLT